MRAPNLPPSPPFLPSLPSPLYLLSFSLLHSSTPVETIMVEEEEEDGTMTDRHAPEEGMVGEERTGEGSLREGGRGEGEER